MMTHRVNPSQDVFGGPDYLFLTALRIINAKYGRDCHLFVNLEGDVSTLCNGSTDKL